MSGALRGRTAPPGWLSCAWKRPTEHAADRLRSRRPVHRHEWNEPVSVTRHPVIVVASDLTLLIVAAGIATEASWST